MQISSHLLKKSFMEIFSFFVQWDIYFVRTLLINIENQCNCEALLHDIPHDITHVLILDSVLCVWFFTLDIRSIFSAIIFILSITIIWLKVVSTFYSCKILPQQLLMNLKEHVRLFSFSCNPTLEKGYDAGLA